MVKSLSIILIALFVGGCSILPKRQQNKKDCVLSFINEGLTGVDSVVICKYVLDRGKNE